MELKWKSGIDAGKLDSLSEEALKQINKRKYDEELIEKGVTNIVKLGIAFSGKKVVIKTVAKVDK